MSNPLRPAVHRPLLAALITGTLVASSAAVAPAAQRSSAPTGGAPIGGLAPNHASQGKVPSPPGKHAHGKWLTGVTITEYWPAPERGSSAGWSSAPGLCRQAPDRLAVLARPACRWRARGSASTAACTTSTRSGDGGWVTARRAQSTSPSDGWAGGSPFWRAGRLLAQPLGGGHVPAAGRRLVGGRGPQVRPAARRHVRRRAVAAAAATTSRSPSIRT